MDDQNSNPDNNLPTSPPPGPTPADGFTSIPSQSPPLDNPFPADPNSFNQPPPSPPVEAPQDTSPPQAPQEPNPQSSFNQIPSPATPTPQPPLDNNNTLADLTPLAQDNPAPPPQPPVENPIPTFLDQSPQNTQPADLANQSAALNQVLNNPAPNPTPITGWGDVPNNPAPTPISSEPAPTDLSQLTGSAEQNSPTPDVFVPPASAPAENVVVPAMSPDPEAVGSVATGSPKTTKLLIGGGIVVVLLVLGASSYFILGIGKNNDSNTPESTQSLPAQQAPLTNPPRQVIAPPPTPEPSEEASESGSLGSLTSEGTASASATPTSAIERLRQRQGQ